MPFVPVDDALEAIRKGKMVILVDDEDRENEGDLCIAAEMVTPESINFMAKFARGLICLTLTDARLRELEIPMMVRDNTSPLGTAFTVSIEARSGVTTGISAADRARTVRVAVDDETKPTDLTRPGHIFPLRAQDGGVLVRTGQTEGSVDLCRLAGLKPAAVICEVMRDDGEMARMPDLEEFGRLHDMPIVSIADLIEYRLSRESMIERLLTAPYETHWGQRFQAVLFESRVDGAQHLAVVCGDPATNEGPTLVRVQHEDLISDVFGANRSDSGTILKGALDMISAEGCGVVVYLQNPEQTRLENLMTTVLGKRKSKTDPDAINRPQPELRSFGVGAQILRQLGVGPMRLITTNPKSIVGLSGFGLEVVGQVSPFDADQQVVRLRSKSS